MNIRKFYPITNVVWKSKHGNILIYTSGANMIRDEELGYLDDIMDCLDLYTGPEIGFRNYCIECQEKELEFLRAETELPKDQIDAGIIVVEKKAQLLKGEPESGMAQMCQAWRANREKAKYRMLKDFEKRRNAQKDMHALTIETDSKP